MKISVIVPVYNCAPYVERCIHSIMAQTHTDLEIICVDDGSTDGSSQLLDKLTMEDPRIHVIHQSNAGVSAARNAGIDIATGDLITFVDSDDAIEPDMYEILLPYFSDESVDIVHCGYKRIRPDGSVKDVNGTGKVVYQNKYEAAECLISGKLFVGSLCNKIYRSLLFREVRLDTSLAINEDVLFNSELFSKANNLVYTDIGKYLMYERKGSATSGTDQYKQFIDCAEASRKILLVYRTTPVEQTAMKRNLYSLISLYRWYVMNSLIKSRQERKDLANHIEAIIKKRTDISQRQCLNYRFMRYLPLLYKIAYRIYDKIRVPNWDVE